MVNYDGNDSKKSFSKNFPDGICLCAVCTLNFGSDKITLAGSKSKTTSTSSVASYTIADLYDDRDPLDEEMDTSKAVGVVMEPEMDISNVVGMAMGRGTSRNASSSKAHFDTETSLRVTTKSKDSSNDSVCASPRQSKRRRCFQYMYLSLFCLNSVIRRARMLLRSSKRTS